MWDGQSSAHLWHPGHVQNKKAQKANSAWLRTNTNAPLVQAALIHPQRKNDAVHN